MTIQVAPLNSSFMVSSMLGILISLIWVYPQAQAWGAAFTLVFSIMFISSLISMTFGPAEAELKMDRPKRNKR
jgi:hypothetical protein